MDLTWKGMDTGLEMAPSPNDTQPTAIEHFLITGTAKPVAIKKLRQLVRARLATRQNGRFDLKTPF